MLAEAIKLIVPDAEPGRDFVLQDDGEGAYIRDWRHAAPRPTAQQLAVAYVQIDAERLADPLKDRKTGVAARLADDPALSAFAAAVAKRLGTDLATLIDESVGEVTAASKSAQSGGR